MLLLAIVLGGAVRTYAGTGESGRGWLWGGENGQSITTVDPSRFGWMSMNSLSCDTDKNTFVDVACGGNNTTTPAHNYGVNIPSSNGALSGYAWSDNYGWISFNSGDVAGCPSGVCSANRAGNALTGWARILSIRDGGANSGGWFGFISLSGTATNGSPYGVNIDTTTNKMGGYAWSDELGWIDFSLASVEAPKYLTLCATSPLNPTALNLTLGGTQNLKAYYGTQQNVCGGSNVDVTGSVSFTSSAAGIVSMSGATATGAGTGSATITGTCTSAAVCGSTPDTLPATVSVAACTVDPNSVTACNNSVGSRCPNESCWDNCGNFVNVGTSTTCSGGGWHEVTPN